ncbi:MAG: hypothetical protein M1383_01200 [Patescibacteria group bacterium]|nr:hypothetical protein [Patescibacteria group bacterium]
MKRLILAFGCIISLAMAQNANHHVGTETELAANGSVANYLFYNYHHFDKALGLSAIAFHAISGDGSKITESGAGPSFQTKRWFLNTYIGGTADKRLAIALFGAVKLPGKFSATAMTDPKFQIGNGPPTVWFCKAWLGRHNFYARWEYFSVSHSEAVSGKAGFEVRLHPNENIEAFGNPYYDYRRHAYGIQGGFRLRIF